MVIAFAEAVPTLSLSVLWSYSKYPLAVPPLSLKYTLPVEAVPDKILIQQ